MKRMLILFTVGLLALAVAAPATAAPDPDKNKHLFTLEIDCTNSNVRDLGVFTVHAKGVPGWPTEPWSATPIHFRAASPVQVWEGGEMVFEWETLPPPGLEDSKKLVGPCVMHFYGGDTDVFDVLSYNAYYFFPRPAE